MEKKKIYIVMMSTGQYDDSFECPYRAFTNKNSADKLVKEKTEYYRDLEDKYRSIDFDVQGKLNEMFDRYLQDTDKDLYEGYQKTNYPYFDELFNWDKYYDKEMEFKENKELVKKYMDICGLTEKEREAVAVYMEYENEEQSHDGLPCFYVSNHVLDLEDEY